MASATKYCRRGEMNDKKLFIGTSGFYYPHWQGVFYPRGLIRAKYFEYFSTCFHTVELNSTFYHRPRIKTVEHWRDKSPADFLFSLKAHRGITHYRRLRECRDDLYLFLHLVKPLKAKLAALLFQLPPSLEKDVSLLEDFLQILPSGYRCAFEFRHGGWYTEQVYALLAKKNAAFCLHDFARQPTPLMDPADFVYLRLHGPDGHYGGCYSDEQLQAWAKNIAKFLERGKTVFCYFNNDGEGNAVLNARRLSELLAA